MNVSITPLKERLKLKECNKETMLAEYKFLKSGSRGLLISEWNLHVKILRITGGKFPWKLEENMTSGGGVGVGIQWCL